MNYNMGFDINNLYLLICIIIIFYHIIIYICFKRLTKYTLLFIIDIFMQISYYINKI